MTMKRTELDKRAGLKIRNAMRQGQPPALAAAANQADQDRRARRERDRALGLVPVPLKLPSDLLQRLQQRAAAQGRPPGDLIVEAVERLLAA
jgi:hypothetical protein